MVNLQGVSGSGDATAIIEVLSRVLTQLIDLNRNVTSKQQLITKFQSSYPPTISILAYLERINKYAKCSPNCFIIALIYIDRLIETRNVILSNLNVHRVLITSVMLATKVFDDEFYKNAYYAKLGGVSTQEINSLELEFLSLMNFDFFVTVETFEKYQKELSAFVTPPAPAMSAGAEEAGVGGGLGLSTPSPPVLLSCGQYKTNQTNGQTSQPPHMLGAVGMGVGMVQSSQTQAPPLVQQQDVSSFDMPYDSSSQQFVTVTPPPLVSPSTLEQQQSYFSGQSQLQPPPQPPQMLYPVGGDIFAQQNQQGMGMGMGVFAGGVGGGGGGGHYIPGTTVTTPTSVADQVFSWGSGGATDSSAAALLQQQQQQKHHQQQQQQMTRLHPPTQLFPTSYYHPATVTNSCKPFTHEQHRQTQPQVYAAPCTQMSNAPFNNSAHLHHGHMKHQQSQPQHQSYFYPNQHLHNHSGHHHHQQQQHFVVAAGGGYWAPMP